VPIPESIACRAATLRPFACSSTGEGLEAAWVHVAGSLDLATCPELERTLEASPARLVVLDLRDLEFMDCSGVHTIIDATVQAHRDGRRMILLRAPREVDRVFALTGTDDVVEIGDLGPLLASPGQLHLRIADETLVP
jgi:anti-anti-sigma factor